MNYLVENRRSGKTFAFMLELKQNIEKGLRCSVATLNPEKTKRDFEYMTGSKLNLGSSDDEKDIYVALLNR